jgi:hypothetical protein
MDPTDPDSDPDPQQKWRFQARSPEVYAAPQVKRHQTGENQSSLFKPSSMKSSAEKTVNPEVKKSKLLLIRGEDPSPYLLFLADFFNTTGSGIPCGALTPGFLLFC